MLYYKRPSNPKKARNSLRDVKIREKVLPPKTLPL